MRNRVERAWVLMAAAILLTGCISVGPKQSAAESIYTLHAPPSGSAAARVGNKARAVIVVPKPELPAGFETERIALLFQQGHRLDYYASAKWSAPLDRLLQDFLIQKVQQELPGKVAGPPELAMNAQYRLAIKFTDLEPVYTDMPDKPPRLDVAATVTVISLPRETVKAQFTIKKSAPASANNLRTITGELENLLQSLTDEALLKASPNLA